ncbi:MAG: hypothetical protein EOO27_44340 [Comamonadaceae bacterium]|nr:MAG: hypothetical protein EOO27_44340 [Comamonadaceae bacterium]
METKDFSGSARAIGGLALLLALATTAVAAPTTTKFDATAKVESTPLMLNGAGTRYKTVFRVYDMALYTQRKVTTPQELLALPGPKRLDVTALRDLSSTEIGLAFVQGMRANATKEQTTRHLASMSRLIEIFSSRSKLLAGEYIGMQYTPGKGTTFLIMGEPQGAPVGDAEFFNMVLNIWVGPSPAEPLLKDALLGQ